MRAHIRLTQYLALFLVLVAFVFPIFWMFVGVLKLNVEHSARPPVFFPHHALDAFSNAVSFLINGAAIPITRLLVNSTIVTIGTLVITLPLAIVAAYGFGRYKVGGQIIPFLLLSLRMIPSVAVGVPIFMMYSYMGLLDTRIGLILAYSSTTLPITIWLLREFVGASDISLEEAALIDGASRLQVLWHVFIPLTRPGIVTVSLLTFIAAWNEFFLSILLTRGNATTLPAILPLFLPKELVLGTPVSCAFLLALVTAIPVAVLVLCLQRYLVAGVTLSGVTE